MNPQARKADAQRDARARQHRGETRARKRAQKLQIERLGALAAEPEALEARRAALQATLEAAMATDAGVAARLARGEWVGLAALAERIPDTGGGGVLRGRSPFEHPAWRAKNAELNARLGVASVAELFGYQSALEFLEARLGAGAGGPFEVARAVHVAPRRRLLASGGARAAHAAHGRVYTNCLRPPAQVPWRRKVSGGSFC